jgi:hypothetical protein
MLSHWQHPGKEERGFQCQAVKKPGNAMQEACRETILSIDALCDDPCAAWRAAYLGTKWERAPEAFHRKMAEDYQQGKSFQCRDAGGAYGGAEEEQSRPVLEFYRPSHGSSDPVFGDYSAYAFRHSGGGGRQHPETDC